MNFRTARWRSTRPNVSSLLPASRPIALPVRAASTDALSSAASTGQALGASTTQGGGPFDKEGLRQRNMATAYEFIKSDLDKVFRTGDMTPYGYAENMKFDDPLVSTTDLNGYLLNMKMLTTLFNCKFDLHSLKMTGADEITGRWTMTMLFWLLPWRPTLCFTGTSVYKVDTDTGLILSQKDYWDALQKSGNVSMEGAQLVLRQFMNLQQTPDIETQRYQLLKSFQDYEIRKYDKYLVAETSMPSGEGPASGSGFTELAGYIFGGNKEGDSLAMTSPVISTITPGQKSTTMQFVMESRFTDSSSLPTPRDARVIRKEESGGYFAAIRFSGWPLDWEVVSAERDLRNSLAREGLKGKPGYLLARYNEPTVPPFLRRNEVLIELDGYEWRPEV